jgi:RNA polymerase sigma-70 factor (ECF subfamily)
MKHAEESIIDCLARADVAGMRMMFENYYQALCIFALRYVNSFALAEDVVQEELTRFWEKRKGTRFEGSPRSFLFATTRNAALNAMKRAGRVAFVDIEEQVDLLLDDFDLIEAGERERRVEAVRREVDKLPPRCREVFLLVVVHELQHKEVAERLNVSINTVRTQYARALHLLRNRLDTIILLLLFPDTHAIKSRAESHEWSEDTKNPEGVSGNSVGQRPVVVGRSTRSI